MRFIILTQYPFPFGQAQTNRVISIAKGLSYSGARTTVAIFKPVYHNELGINYQGVFENVEYVYPGGITQIAKGLIGRAWLYCYSIYKTLRYLIKEDQNEKIDAIILGYTSPFVIFIFSVISKTRKIRFIHERSEYPFLSYPETWTGKLQLKFYMKIAIRRFNGFILITDALIDYFIKFLKNSKPFYKLPILVEPERFEIVRKPEFNCEYIAYSGAMKGDKDGVDGLINAFGQVSKIFPDLMLFLIGETNFEGFSKLEELIDKFGLKNKIRFTGLLNRDEVAEYLVHARALVLSRPSNIQAKGGFPTKLGEYLATGNPVIVTNVGEISDYLKDGRNAFVVEPNKDDKFAEKIAEVLSDRENAKKVGLQGKLLAQNVFNYRIQGIKLVEWIQNLRK